MTGNLQLVVTLNGRVAVGANPQPANELTLSISSAGGRIDSTSRRPRMLCLEGRLGQGAEALFARKEDARDRCEITRPDGWEVEWEFPPGDSVFRLLFYTYNDVLLAEGAVVRVTLARVISQTAPGRALLSFGPENAGEGQPLTVEKSAPRPDIIYFAAEPEAGVRMLPGSSVTLRWRTAQLDRRELTQVGDGPLVADFDREEGSATVRCGGSDTTFRLKGYPRDGSQPIERELVVRVLQPGWHAKTNTLFEGDPGHVRPAEPRIDLEPTLLLNASDQFLYGVFRYSLQGREQAFLFRTAHPFAPWQLVRSSVPRQAGAIPEGCSTSPGVYCDDRIWLVGGSQIDPGIVSNRVWCLDPGRKDWQDCGTAAWVPRMGHAVLVVGACIWVMGGRSRAGQALNDVWSFDPAAGKWSPLEPAPWPPRCLFGATTFRGQVWVYGGAVEPFSEELHNDLYVYEDGAWGPREITGILAGAGARLPIAVGLQEFPFGSRERRLCLIGRFRTLSPIDRSECVETLAFSLATPSAGAWVPFPSEGLKDWGSDTTFSCRLVNFQDRLLIATALCYERTHPVIKIHVPDVSG